MPTKSFNQFLTEQKVTQQKKVFVNEIGNRITILVKPAAPVKGKSQLVYHMIGPTSEIENTITLKEARVLYSLLRQALNE